MNSSFRASVARVVAKLVARRTTRQDEIPELVESVQVALGQLGRRARPMLREPEDVPVAPPRPRSRPPLRVHAVVLPASEPVPPPPPRLLRRADVMATASQPEETVTLRPTQHGVLRGVVRWFDQHARRGALRLPGLSGDVPVEPGLLDAMAITRLYKGQEVEATLSENTAPRVVRLVVPGGASQQNLAGGVVRGRHAKPVVVELKREALRRAAARAEAESVLGRGRNR